MFCDSLGSEHTFEVRRIEIIAALCILVLEFDREVYLILALGSIAVVTLLHK